jgi:SAM-dependent methyltransferase
MGTEMNEQKQVENSFWDEKWNHVHGAKHLKYFTAIKLLRCDINKKTLDYGAGNGNFLDLLVELHHEKKNLTAYDISKTAMTICKEKGYSVTSDPFLDGIVYDQVVLIDVLEHLNNPVELLTKIRNIGLEVILVVPNFSSIKQRLQVLFGLVPFQNRPQRGGHVYWMNLDVIKEIAAQSKIQVIEFQYLFPNKKIYTLLFSCLFKVFPNVFANSIGVRGVYCD